jgi:predicted HTH domain antitoxin
MSLKEIVESVPIFKTMEKKETFLIIMSALSMRLISLSRAAEAMEMHKEALLELLDAFGVSYSYLEDSDVESEKTWQ